MTFLEVDPFFFQNSLQYTWIDSWNYRCCIYHIHTLYYILHTWYIHYIICYTYSCCIHYTYIFYIHYIKHYTYIVLHIIYVCMCVCVCIHIYIDKTLLYSDIAQQGGSWGDAHGRREPVVLQTWHLINCMPTTSAPLRQGSLSMTVPYRFPSTWDGPGTYSRHSINACWITE